MGFWDDIINGGLDRDFDGDIDSRDRQIGLEEEWLREQRQAEEDRIHEQQRHGWRDYHLDGLIDYGVDPDDYEDEEEYLDAIEEAKREKWSFDSDCDIDIIDPADYENEYEYLEAVESYKKEKKRAVEDETVSNIATISFSIAEPERTKPTTGVWKYYDEDFGGMWNFDQALIEQFPELADDYEPNVSCYTLRDIIVETYEIDKERAVKYLKWLWNTFTPDLFEDEKEKPGEGNSFRIRAGLIKELIWKNSGDEYLYKIIKNDKDFLITAFRDCVHEKHNYNFAQDVIEEMLIHKDVKAAKTVYLAYLEGQKGRYTDKDLGKLWCEIANQFEFVNGKFDYSEKEQIAVIKGLIPLVEKLGERSKKPLNEFNGIIEMLEDHLDEDEDKECDEEKIEECPDYSWRKKVAPSKRRYANPDDYETMADFEIAVDKAYKEYEEKIVLQRREKYTAKEIVHFCKVDLGTLSRTLLYYLFENLDLYVGDKVIVPFGADDKEYEATVVTVGDCYTSTFPCDISRIKTVKGKA